MRIHFTPNYNQNFQGIYKIKTSDNDKYLIKFLNDNDFVIRISEPFTEKNNRYMYVITSDNFTAETFFENDLRRKNIPFWKSLPFFRIANKKILDNIFDENKKICGKEIWTN